MSTMEKALIQIFERKDRIIDHVKQQILLFDRHLASKCLIQGFVPPPWLLSTSPTELNKEDLISGLLFPNPQPSISYSSLYQRPVVTTDNVQFPSALCTRVDAWNEGLDQCLSGKADELDPSVTSPPQDCRDGMISGSGPDPGLSLARIHRSKSRQRALEQRSNAKACKNVESSEKNGDACNSQNKGSKIASLWSDPVDKWELIRSGDNVMSFAAEEEERGQCRGKERSENVYSGRVTRSRSSVQPPKSVSGTSGAGNSSCFGKQDVALTESTSNSQQPGVVHEILESKLVEPFHNTVSCALKNEEIDQCRSNERGEDTYSGRITRSRSSSQPPNSVNGSPSAKQDGIMLTESIDRSILQPNAVDELLQFVKPVDNVVTCVLAEEKRSQCQSKVSDEDNYSVSITRSRSSVQSPQSVYGLSCGGKASDIAKQDRDLLIKSISKSKQQPNVVDELLELVKPAVISDKSCGYTKARDHLSKKKESGVYEGRLTRSRSCSKQHTTVNKDLKLDSCTDKSIDDGICKSAQLTCHVNDLEELNKPSDISGESCGNLAKRSDYDTKENAIVDQYNNGSTGSRANCSAKLLNLVGSSIIEYGVTQCNLTASDKSPYVKSSDRSEGVVLKDSDTQVNSLPFANASDLANLNQCVAIVADTDADSDALVESRPVSSASNLDGASNPPLAKSLNRYERIELEVVVTSAHSASAMKMMPKQLDFDNLGECSLNEASSPVCESKDEIKSLEKRSLAELPSADKLDEVALVHYQEKYNSSATKQLLEEQEVISKEEEQSETDLNKTYGPGQTSFLNVLVSAKETPEASTDAVTTILPVSNKMSEQEISMEHHSLTLQAPHENLRGNSPKDASGSRLSVDTGADYLFEKDYRKLGVVISATSVPDECDLNPDVCSGPAIFVDNGFTEVCSPSLLRKADATSSDAMEHPCALLIKETEVHSVKQKMESSPSQNRDADSMGICIADDIDSVQDPKHAKSSEHKFAIQSIQPGRHSGSYVEGSWPHKRRRIDGQQSISLSLLLSLKEEDLMQLNANKSLVDEDQNAGNCSWKEGDRSEVSPSTLMHKQYAVASASSLPQETLENSEYYSTEGTRVVGQSSIMFGSTVPCTAYENKSEFGNIEYLTCDERSTEESKSQLGEDVELSTFAISPPCQPPTDLISADETNPVLEGFILQTDSEQICTGGDGISFDKLDLPKTTIERASLLEQLCKSACSHTPLSQFSTAYKLNRTTDLYLSVPNGLLECMDLKSTLPINDDSKSQPKVSTGCFGEDKNHAFLGGYFSDCLPFSSSQVTGDVKKPYLSPVGKLWDRIASSSGSSEKRGSLNSELPCISEENENTDEVVDAFHEDSASKVVTCSVKRKPLTEIRECPNVPASGSGAENFTVRDSLDSVNIVYSFAGTENGVKEKVEQHNASKRRNTNKMKENRSIPPGANGTKRASESSRNRFSKPKLSEKTSLRKGGPSFSQKESKVNNIVSNVTSFIPMVQEKQAATVMTGKRDVKVKALEAAEAAKRLAEKKENDRKMKKEALKLERARLEQENLRQLELEKKKKEDERKKKEADMAAKKRQREGEERLEKERKRKRMEEARRQQRVPEVKLCAKKDKKQRNCQALDERGQTMKAPNDEAEKHEKMQKDIAVGNEGKMVEAECRTAVASISDALKASSATFEDFYAKVMTSADKSTTESDTLIGDTSLEQSYDISPYKGSDDEDEEEDDDELNGKFIPSWANKRHVALVITSQQKLDPEVIFPPKSFCSISEVLLPRKLQQNRVS